MTDAQNDASYLENVFTCMSDHVREFNDNLIMLVFEKSAAAAAATAALLPLLPFFFEVL